VAGKPVIFCSTDWTSRKMGAPPSGSGQFSTDRVDNFITPVEAFGRCLSDDIHLHFWFFFCDAEQSVDTNRSLRDRDFVPSSGVWTPRLNERNGVGPVLGCLWIILCKT